MSGLLALIPARAGSKRIAEKNIRLLCGRPLIAHTLETTLASDCFSRIIVSTDDEQIAKVARQYGAEVPWLRSPENSSDTSTVIDAIQEVLDRIGMDGDPLPEGVMLLQPTSPFRTVKSIHQANALYRQSHGESVVSVSPAAIHPLWCKRIVGNGELVPFIHGVECNMRSQDLPLAYALNGVIYLTAVANIRARRSIYSEHTRALVIESREEAVDIDTPFDWILAEAICAASRETRL